MRRINYKQLTAPLQPGFQISRQDTHTILDNPDEFPNDDRWTNGVPISRHHIVYNFCSKRKERVPCRDIVSVSINQASLDYNIHSFLVLAYWNTRSSHQLVFFSPNAGSANCHPTRLVYRNVSTITGWAKKSRRPNIYHISEYAGFPGKLDWDR
jgi:hypothetical protein